MADSVSPVGRLMISNVTNIAPPPNTQVRNNNSPNGSVALAPAVLQHIGNAISGDFSATFPDWFKTMTDNPKYDFGPVTLMISCFISASSMGSSNRPESLMTGSSGAYPSPRCFTVNSVTGW